MGAIVATGDTRGAVGVAGAVVGEDAGGSGAGVEGAGPLTDSGVVRIGVSAEPVVVSGKRAFVRRSAKIKSATPIIATPIQLYPLMGGGTVRAGRGIGARSADGEDVSASAACVDGRTGAETRGVSGDDGAAENGADDAAGGVGEDIGASGDATGCPAGRDAADGGCALPFPGARASGAPGAEEGTAGAVPDAAAAARTRATTRRNAARRSSSLSATSASARHTRGSSGRCAARARSTARARCISPCSRSRAATFSSERTAAEESGLRGMSLINLGGGGEPKSENREPRTGG